MSKLALVCICVLAISLFTGLLFPNTCKADDSGETAFETIIHKIYHFFYHEVIIPKRQPLPPPKISIWEVQTSLTQIDVYQDITEYVPSADYYYDAPAFDEDWPYCLYPDWFRSILRALGGK